MSLTARVVNSGCCLFREVVAVYSSIPLFSEMHACIFLLLTMLITCRRAQCLSTAQI